MKQKRQWRDWSKEPPKPPKSLGIALVVGRSGNAVRVRIDGMNRTDWVSIKAMDPSCKLRMPGDRGELLVASWYGMRQGGEHNDPWPALT